MTKYNKTQTTIAQEIEAQELELKELLCRVMKSPLQPLTDQAAKLEERLKEVEGIAKETSEQVLTAQSRIFTQGENVERKIKDLKKEITNDISTQLNERLASMPQEITHLLQDQASVKHLIGEIRQEQESQSRRAKDTSIQSEVLLLKSHDQLREINLAASAAVQASDKVITRIDESRVHLGKNLDSMREESRAEGQKVGAGVATLAGALNRTNEQVSDLAPTISRQTDELGSRLESAFFSFREQSHLNLNSLSNSLHAMQRRFVWLCVLCGLSFAGSISLIVSGFVPHLLK